MYFSCLHDLLGPALPMPEEMAAWDAASINEFHIPEMLLMENASREAFHVLKGLLEPQRRILVLVGGGNNGGDGVAVARHLLNAGHTVLVCHTKPLETLSPTVQTHVTMAAKAGVPFIPLALGDRRLITPPERRKIAQSPHIVIDALLGTGFTAPVREKEREIIRFINQFSESASVIALDIPSGLDGLTGAPKPEAVRAKHTITFEAAKPGLVFPHAAEYTGMLHVRPIGIPEAVRKLHPASFRLLDPRPDAWPANDPAMHKGTAGRVMIFGGSQGLAGAPALAALGALRTGAGLITVACPSDIEPQIRPAFPEIMTLPLGNGLKWTNALLPACVKAITEMPHASALVLGPGMGRSPETRDIVETIVMEKKRPPLVLDADGLYHLCGPKGAHLLAHLRQEDCISPHPGEAARILETTPKDVQMARIESIRTLIRETKAIVVLKGAGTLIARHDTPICIAPYASPCLAVGGSGDVLSGVIAAYLARIRAAYPSDAEDAFRAVCLGVCVHGRAGRMLDLSLPHRGALAREIADAIPLVPRGQSTPR